MWSVVRAQYFEKFGRLVRDGVHQTLPVLFHVIFSLKQSKNLELSYISVQIIMYILAKVFKLPKFCNLLLDFAQHASINHSIVSVFLTNQEGKPTKGNLVYVIFPALFSGFSVLEFAAHLPLCSCFVPNF